MRGCAGRSSQTGDAARRYGVPRRQGSAGPSRTAILAVVFVSTSISAQSELRIVVGGPEGVIRPLLGVNTGPRVFRRGGGEHDFTDAYRRLGVRQIRTHDLYGPLDMATIYPDQRADPRLPSSFRFDESDRFFDSIISGGFEPYLRLGDSWNAAEGYPRPRRRAPIHLDNWVAAAVAVVRHYEARSQGRLRYVEIWNEPDLRVFWDASPEAFCELYVRAARAVKAACPRLKVGGPGFALTGFLQPQGREFVRVFLDQVRRAGAPLDFLSWHIYSNDPREYAAAARYYRGMLDRFGFPEAESHLTEFHTDERRPVRGLPTVAIRAGAPGAAILTAGWIALQMEGVAAAFVYRGADPDTRKPDFYGLLLGDERPKKTALAFSMWAKFCECRERLTVSGPSPETGPWVLAGRTAEGRVALLIANPSAQPISWDLSFGRGAPTTGLHIEEVSEDTDSVRVLRCAGSRAHTPADGVQLVWPVRE